MVTCRSSVTGIEKGVPADKLQFRPSVYGLIIHYDQILLNGFRGGYIFPGGGIDPGETLNEALEREIFEETGLSVTQETFLHFEEHFVISDMAKVETYFHTFRWYFLCKDPVGEISTIGFTELERNHMQEPQWIPIDQIRNLKIYHPHDPIALIQKALVNSVK